MPPDLTTWLLVLIKLLLAVVLGGAVGWQREAYEKPAGFRTHILVCVGAATYTLVSLWFIGETGRVADSAAATAAGNPRQSSASGDNDFTVAYLGAAFQPFSGWDGDPDNSTFVMGLTWTTGALLFEEPLTDYARQADLVPPVQPAAVTRARVVMHELLHQLRLIDYRALEVIKDPQALGTLMDADLLFTKPDPPAGLKPYQLARIRQYFVRSPLPQ